jgi:hypothetical protein
MARLHAALAAVCLVALLSLGPNSSVRAGTDVPEYQVIWTNAAAALNCFVVPNYRITNSIWDTSKASGAGACFRRCAANNNNGAGYYGCYSWTYNKRTRRCSMSEAYLGYGSGESDEYPLPNWVKSSSYVSGYVIGTEDRK